MGALKNSIFLPYAYRWLWNLGCWGLLHLVRSADSKPMYKEGKSIDLVMRVSASAIELVFVPENRPLEFLVAVKVFLHRRVF